MSFNDAMAAVDEVYDFTPTRYISGKGTGAEARAHLAAGVLRREGRWWGFLGLLCAPLTRARARTLTDREPGGHQQRLMQVVRLCQEARPQRGRRARPVLRALRAGQGRPGGRHARQHSGVHGQRLGWRPVRRRGAAGEVEDSKEENLGVGVGCSRAQRETPKGTLLPGGWPPSSASWPLVACARP